MNIIVYKEQYVLDIFLYDDSFYTVPFENFKVLKKSLNSEKFIQVKDDLVATSSIKKVVKRKLEAKVDGSYKYQNFTQSEPVSKETLAKFRGMIPPSKKNNPCTITSKGL